jgi:cellulose synthase/poly-beta-1,6-N-acetylglucosamine synthase-like glycosyltransferase
MLEQFIQNQWGLLFVVMCVVGWIVQIIYLLGYFRLSVTGKESKQEKKIHPVSVVICARNEEKNLMNNLPVIMDQRHPDFEVIVVNDSSWDDTGSILKAYSLRYSNLRVVSLDEEKQNMHGKKFALTLGIKAAKHDIVLLTDADCVPTSEDWITEMTCGMTDKKQIALGFSPYNKYPGWINRIIRFDTLMIAIQYLGFAKSGKPYMGVGRNLAYNKEVFFKVGGFKNHYSIASGDDDLFINQVANSTNTITITAPESQTISEPKKTWPDWFTQKRRHFTTSPFYKTEHKRMLAIWPLTFLMMIAGFMGALVFQTGLLLVSTLVLLRYVVQIAILHKVSKRLAQSKDIVWLALPLEIHLYILNLGLYFTNLMRKPQKWN